MKKNTMLKKLFILILILPAFAYMQAQEICTINGYIQKDSLRFTPKRIEKVYLSFVNEYDQMITLDSVPVNNGKFTFKRTLSKNDPLLLYFITGFDNGYVLVFVEPGTINVQIPNGAFPGGGIVKGTVTNDMYNQYKMLSEHCISAQNDTMRAVSRSRGSEWLESPEGETFRMRIGASELMLCNAERIQFLLEHNDTPLAPLLMEREISYMMNKRTAEQLLNALSPALKSHPYYRSFANAVRSQNLAVGKELPDVSIPLVDGRTISLSDYRGKYVLLDFWASWCSPCLREVPKLIELYDEATAQKANFVIISYSLDNKENSWKNMIKSKGMDKSGWVHGSDLLAWGSPIAKMMGVTSIPQTILIDPEGKALSFTLRGDEMLRYIRRILNLEKTP